MGDLFKNEITEILAGEPHIARSPPPMSSTARVLRTTMFRIADPASQQKLVQAYGKLAADQKKVCVCVLSPGAPFLLAC